MKNSLRLKTLSIFMLLIFLNQLFFPTVAWALTGGPGQPETHGFEPVNSNNMVNLFTGDFSYSIPLMDVGGYPINMGYQAGAGMDQEASMVGLGWSLTPGAINRTVRGLPDDFNGDIVKQERNIRANRTIGGSVSGPWEFLGWYTSDVTGLMEKGISVSLGVYHNNYNGTGSRLNIGKSWDLSQLNKKGGESSPTKTSDDNDPGKTSLVTSLNLGFDSKTGISVNPNLSVSYSKQERTTETNDEGAKFLKETRVNKSFGIGLGFQSARGVNGISFGSSSSNNSTTLNESTIDLEKSSSRSSGGGSFSIGYGAKMPVQDYNMRNFNASFDIAVSKEIMGQDFQFQGDFYYSTQYIPEEDNQTEAAGYGAMYYQRLNRNGDENGNDQLLDFNRSSDYAYSPGSQHLHMSQTTYDIFSVSGQGIGGSFKLNTHDIPIYGDPVKENRSTDFPISGLGLDFGPSVKVGGNVSYAEWYDETGGLVDVSKNKLLGLNQDYFNDEDLHFEETYFKMAGEMTPIDSAIFEKLDGYEPTRLQISKSGDGTWFVNRYLKNEEGEPSEIDIDKLPNNRTYKRQPRNTNIHQYTNKEAARLGINRNIFSYGPVTDSSYDDSTNYTPYLRYTDDQVLKHKTRKPHHLGGFDITGANGTRYVYDLPAYNHESCNVAFSKEVAKSEDDYDYYEDYYDDGLISYDTTDASIDNDQGRSHYYTRQETPAHAHSYLLTGILSPDYVDVTGNGITHDDLGTAVKFNYTLHSERYGWRAPYETGKARFNHGLQSLSDDDKATYSYGTKELWYVHSIESKTHVAEFYYSDRQDGIGVSDEQGTKGTTSEQKMQKLDRIELYNKADRFTNKGDAVPIKVVYFEYDYSLCQGLPNNENDPASANSGKLTLKKIRFSYGTSMKAVLSPYEFTYGGLNPDYDALSYDRWGNYKPNEVNAPNSLYPYAEQDTALANERAGAWCLTKIKMPSGGEMNISYEADDYAYVMNKEAHSMVKVKGVGMGVNFNEAEYALYEGTRQNYKLFFDLHPSLYNSSDDDIAAAYLPDDSVLYYKSGIYIKDESEPEQFAGFAKVKDMGGVRNNGKMAWVELEPKKLDLGTKIHPISYNAWEFIISNLNEKIFERSQVPGDDANLKGEFKELAKNLGTLVGFITGKYRQLRMLRYAKNLVPDQTFLRLREPTGSKKGGGLRVRKITMDDNWDAVTDLGEKGTYGVVYDYTTTNDEDEVISSGVASYEPGFGNEENPYVAPIYFDNYKFPISEEKRNKWAKKKLKNFISQEEHIIGPIGETFYPNPVVGYSKVTVKSLATAQSNGTSTGYTVNCFYTARDFPIIIDYTSVDHNIKRPNAAAQLLYGRTRKYIAASQGYTVIANDMHGKAASVSSHNANGVKISGTSYFYRSQKSTHPDSAFGSLKTFMGLQLKTFGHLDNTVKVLDKTGRITEKEIGIDFDISIDTRSQYSESSSARIPSNLDVLTIGTVPIPIPTLYFSNNRTVEQFTTATVTKVIQQHGILEKVVAFDENSIVSTENVLWDESTGQVLMTQTHNEYNDEITNFSYPGHFAYENLGPASGNEGISIKNVTISNGKLTLDQSLGDADQYFSPGDELALAFGEATVFNNELGETSFANRAWVKGVKGNQVFIIDRNGQPVDNEFKKLTIWRSGRRNILGASVGSYTTLEPISLDGQFAVPNSVTQTSAATFSDQWHTYADQVKVIRCDTNAKGVMFETILDSMVQTGWLARSYQATISKKFDLNRVAGYSTSQLNQGFSNINYFEEYVNQDCDTIEVTDSVFIYRIDYEGNYTYITRPTARYKRHTQNPGFLRPPGIPHSVSEIKWSVDTAYTKLRDSIYNCTGTATTVNFNKVKLVRHDSTSLDFGLTLGEDSLTDGIYCIFSLNYHLGSSIDWAAIDSITNLRINPNFSDGTHFTVDAYDGAISYQLTGYTGTCFEIGSCWQECERRLKEVINPYVQGVRGVWRGKDNYAYHDARELASNITEYSDHTQTRLDGAFDYNPFWTFGASGLVSNPSANWISPATLTLVSPAGNHVESVDALGRPSAEVYGYDRKLVTAVGQNAYHHDLAFDGFEDYDYPYYFNCNKAQHWSLQEDSISLANHTKVLFKNPSIAVIDLDNVFAIKENAAHTGRASLFVAKNKYVAATDSLYDEDTTTHNRAQLKVFRVGPGNTIQNFAPEKGKKYVISGWVKQEYSGVANVSGHEDAYLRVKINGTTFDESYYPSGPLVEGWQRVFAEFTIPDEAGAISIEVYAQVGSFTGSGAYFDDIRIQPYNSAMVTYVYDPMTLRLTAELDENNFATFYEYDQEGRLLRIKKETEQGIVTLQESRYGIPKNE